MAKDFERTLNDIERRRREADLILDKIGDPEKQFRQLSRQWSNEGGIRLHRRNRSSISRLTRWWGSREEANLRKEIRMADLRSLRTQFKEQAKLERSQQNGTPWLRYVGLPLAGLGLLVSTQGGRGILNGVVDAFTSTNSTIDGAPIPSSNGNLVQSTGVITDAQKAASILNGDVDSSSSGDNPEKKLQNNQSTVGNNSDVAGAIAGVLSSDSSQQTSDVTENTVSSESVSGLHKGKFPIIPPTVEFFYPEIEKWATEYGVPVEVAVAIATIESGGSPSANSGSAYGLFQIAPGTAAEIASKLGYSQGDYDLNDPKISTQFGVYYLKFVADFAGLSLVLDGSQETIADVAKIAGGYNNGASGLKQHLDGGQWAGTDSKIAETERYVVYATNLLTIMTDDSANMAPENKYPQGLWNAWNPNGQGLVTSAEAELDSKYPGWRDKTISDF